MAVQRGRTECIPPGESPFASSRAFPRKAIPARITNPAEGRAPHARKQSMTPTLTLPPFGYRLVVNPSGGNASARIRPCHTGAETAPLREKRLSLDSRPFPARPSQLGWPTPRRGGLRTPAKPELAWPRHLPARALCPWNLDGEALPPFGCSRETLGRGVQIRLIIATFCTGLADPVWRRKYWAKVPN